MKSASVLQCTYLALEQPEADKSISRLEPASISAPQDAIVMSDAPSLGHCCNLEFTNLRLLSAEDQTILWSFPEMLQR